MGGWRRVFYCGAGPQARSLPGPLPREITRGAPHRPCACHVQCRPCADPLDPAVWAARQPLNRQQLDATQCESCAARGGRLEQRSRVGLWVRIGRGEWRGPVVAGWLCGTRPTAHAAGARETEPAAAAQQHARRRQQAPACRRRRRPPALLQTRRVTPCAATGEHHACPVPDTSIISLRSRTNRASMLHSRAMRPTTSRHPF